ncbi:MAG TPA: HAD-IC family P-type ATPase [Solirubrobacteraceae bacterium]|nr:HAD-IC family P-type ATPase [Solirubrobacteraceae bacterium]
MGAATISERVRPVRAAPGRLRAHLAVWDGRDAKRLERAVRSIDGVLDASARPATGNILVRFAPDVIDEPSLLDELAALRTTVEDPPSHFPDDAGDPAATADADRPASESSLRAATGRWTGVLRDQAGRFGRARIAVRGIDRDPALARRVVDVLERRPDVRRAVASATTGRVLVEFSQRITSMQDLLAELSSIELPDLPGEDRPAHPLDPAPVIQSGARLAGATLGLAYLGAQRILGAQPSTATVQAPAVAAGALGIVDGTPPIRDGLRGVLGRDRAQLMLSGATIVSLALSGSPLGLLVSGAGALRLFTEARLRREAWRDYEQRVSATGDAQPGSVVRLETGARVPLAARVVEGSGTVVGADGLPDGIRPGDQLEPGARVLRGPLLVELTGGRAWEPQPRPGTPRPDALERYLTAVAPASSAYALLHAVRRRSARTIMTGLLLVNPRAALIGSEGADTGASARVLRAGVTVVGTRPERQIRTPDVLFIDGPRVLTSGLEQARIVPVGPRDRAEITDLVAAMLRAAGAPWGPAVPPSNRRRATDAEFDGTSVTASVEGTRLRLAPPEAGREDDPEVRRALDAGEQPLVLCENGRTDPIAFVHLRPRLASGLAALRERCEEHGTEIVVLERDDRRASRMVARRAHLTLALEADLVELVRERQLAGERVAVLSDTPAAAEAFEACDLAIGLSSGRSSVFQARADLLAPGLSAVASIINAGARRDQASNLSVGFSVATNLAGALWGLQGDPGVARASHATYVGALAALGADWERLRGGRRARSVISRLADPRPERWGQMEPAEVLAATESRSTGLRSDEARARRTERPARAQRGAVAAAVRDQLESPLVAVLGTGAALSLAVGAVADVGIIAAVIAANAAVGAWQTRQAGQAVAALEEIGAARATVLRDGDVCEVDFQHVVVGDILLLGAGDRVVADARLVDADALEADEAALTGESLPVPKAPDGERPEERIVLEGSDITVGTGRAVVVAVGAGTRLGATAAALAVEDSGETPLGKRLDRLFRQGMPVVLGGGAVVALSGILRGAAPLSQLAVGATVAVAAVPEGLPLLAGVAEASVARRLAARSALVRRLSAVEALGRVDVACCDKTGTLTQGKLAVTLVANLEDRASLPGELSPALSGVLLAAALASPPPDAPDASAHPTDAAIIDAGRAAGLAAGMRAARRAEARFDPVRSLHATALADRVCVKGAAEAVLERCTHRGPGGAALDDAGRQSLLASAETLAARGLRVLMVAEGPAETTVNDPRNLWALGFIGISDPLRPGVRDAVARCHEAGVRVIMLTGDHPATAWAIAADAGLPLGPEAMITGDEIAAADNGELAERLSRASVIARITPLDKLRIVDRLQQSGHTVAMTGDGVNDAPALRLADVGVAMGTGGTEVARQAADLVLADDRFETLTDALLEGRSLWQNMHGAMGLLLGGNLGEIALMAGAAVVGGGTVLAARQVLAVNLVTDVLPAVAVAVQPPRHSDLRELAREGAESFDQRLLRDIVRRGAATGLPALAAVLAARPLGAAPQTVGFASIILTQLSQTVQAGRSRDNLSGSVLAAVAGSGAMLGAALVVPPVRRFLALPAPTLSALLLSAATAPAAVVVADRLASGAAIDEHARGSVVLRREAPDSQEERPEELEHGR